MQIENVKIKNFKGISDAEVELAGRSVYLIGGNGTGKTSFIDAVWFGLTGKNLPPKPIKAGEKEAEIEIDLGEFIARTKFKQGKAPVFTLENKVFTDKTDKFIASPRSYLNGMIGVLDFDLTKFFSLSDAEQVKYFAKICGQDFAQIDNDIADLYESRRVDGLKLKEYEAKVTYYDKKDLKLEVVSVTKAAQELADAKDKARDYVDGQEALGKVKVRLDEIQENIEKLCFEAYGVGALFPPAEIVPTEDSLVNKEKAIQAWLADPENIPISSEKMEELATAFKTLEETNKRIKDAHDGKANDDLVKKYKDMVEEQTEDIEKKKREKAKLISENIAVEGLAYDMENERFLYDNLPFDSSQINTASQLIAGMKIGSMLLKDLKILKVDASLIDKREFDKVLEWSDAHNIELFVELVDREAEALQIILEES